jgi:integrase/recombinase XerD
MKAYLDLPEIELIERTAGCQRDRLLIRLLSRLACRISEALAIRVCDIDFEQGTVTILHLKRSIKLSFHSVEFVWATGTSSALDAGSR